jgi:hypothetical protein
VRPGGLGVQGRQARLGMEFLCRWWLHREGRGEGLCRVGKKDREAWGGQGVAFQLLLGGAC